MFDLTGNLLSLAVLLPVVYAGIAQMADWLVLPVWRYSHARPVHSLASDGATSQHVDLAQCPRIEYVVGLYVLPESPVMARS